MAEVVNVCIVYGIKNQSKQNKNKNKYLICYSMVCETSSEASLRKALLHLKCMYFIGFEHCLSSV
jgi:hypothetical protein